MVLLQLALASKTEPPESRRLLVWVSCFRAFSCNQIEVLNGIVVYHLHRQTAQFKVWTKIKRNSGLVNRPFPSSPQASV